MPAKFIGARAIACSSCPSNEIRVALRGFLIGRLGAHTRTN
jgi:hypothetical protein